MGKKAQLEVAGQTVQVSNLDKVLYPDSGFRKGEIINYYVQAAEFILPHLKDRPLTLKRYPEGVNAEHFYEKDAPSHKPAWVKTAPVARRGGGPDINFVLINDLPSLVWAANLASIELHVFLARARNIQRPDFLVVDLDPGAPAGVIEAARVGLLVRDLMAELKLESFIKASGSKGCQLYVPLNTPITYAKTEPFAERLATLLEERHPELIVSKMAKDLRGGKVFIDWSQNVDYKTTVCAYSLRAKRAEPYVSMPLTWDEVERAVKKGDPKAFDFAPGAALKRMEKLGDLFAPVLKLKQKLPSIAALEKAAGALQSKPVRATQRTAETKTRKVAKKSEREDASHDGSLAEYDAKRDFSQTAEPGPKREATKDAGKLMFVIQKHAASHLHYDFRIEMDGVLKSWAVPKGPPFTSAERRLAMHVEDHPMSYARFEGTIPPGNYGAGTVMVWDIGTYEVVADKPMAAYHKGKIKMLLRGEKLKGEWTLVRSSRADPSGKQPWYLIKTGGEADPIDDDFKDRSVLTRRTLDEIAEHNDAQWQSNRASSEKVSSARSLPRRPQVPTAPREPRSKRLRARAAKQSETKEADRGAGVRLQIQARGPAAKPAFVRPMLAKLASALPEGKDWLYEIKFDGFRCIAVKSGSKVDLFSRNGNSFNADFPAIRRALAELPFDGVLDGEVVAVTPEGAISFQALQGAGSTGGATIHYYAFDLLNLDGKSLLQLPVSERKALLETAYDWGADPLLHYSGPLKGKPQELIRAVASQGLEGIIAKKATSIYEVGRRSDCWVKFKTNREGDFVIGGWRKLDSPSRFDAIYVGYMDGGKLRYAAKVLAGFTPMLRRKLAETASPHITNQQPFHELKIGKGGRFSEGLTQEDVDNSVWLKPVLVAAIEFVEWTHAGHLRHPRFKGLRPDKSPGETNKPGTA